MSEAELGATLALDALIEALDAPHPDPSDDPEEIDAWMTERRDLVGLLETHAKASLSPDDRARVRACIERVLARDVELVRVLILRRQQIRAALDTIPSARAGVRGYAAANREEPPIPIRSV